MKKNLIMLSAIAAFSVTSFASDINKEMFKYLIERIANLECSIKKEENCTLEEKNEILEKEYNEFIETLSSNKKE